MTAPTLIATVPTPEQLAELVIPMPAIERAWLEFGASLLDMHAEQTEARFREGITGAERDRVGFAAKGLALAIEIWNDTTETHLGRHTVWTRYTTMLAADMAAGYNDSVRAGLELAAARAQAAQEEYLAVYGG